MTGELPPNYSDLYGYYYPNNVPVAQANYHYPYYSTALPPCQFCGKHRGGSCPYVESIEYHENGEIKKVVFWPRENE